MTFNEKPHILLVEDSASDAILMRETFKDLSINAHFTHVTDGIHALDYLRDNQERDPTTRRTLPDLILLDLNLPRMDGRELLCLLKSDPAFRTIPVIVLSTSTAERDVLFCYENYVNCYLQKPLDLINFAAIAKAIEIFWLKQSVLPTRL